MYSRIAQQWRCIDDCRTSPHARPHPSTQRTMQHIHRTVSIILDRLDLDLSPPHVGSGCEGQVLMVVEMFWLSRFRGGLGAADVSAQWETGPFSASG